MKKENKRRALTDAPMECAIDINHEIPKILGRLKSMAHNYYTSRDDVLDLVQDTVLRLMESRCTENVSSRDDLVYLAFRIMRTIRYNDWRHEGIISWIHLDSEDDYGCVDGERSLDSRLALEEVYALAEKDRKVNAVVMSGEGYSQKEIAERTGVPVGTVMSRVSYGKKLLLQMA